MSDPGTTTRADRAQRGAPERTCVGCGEKAAPGALARVVRGPSSEGGIEVAFDLSGGAFGRGAWLHPALPCFERAARGGLARSFRAPVKATVGSLAAMYARAAARRVAGLLSAARRAGGARHGADATGEALREGAGCVVVANDAKSVVERRDITDAIARGLAVSFGSKETLGALFNRDEVAVIAVTDPALAAEIVNVWRAAAALAGSGSKAWAWSEDR